MAIADILERWRQVALLTEPCDRDAVEWGISRMYRDAWQIEVKAFCWLFSPRQMEEARQVLAGLREAAGRAHTEGGERLLEAVGIRAAGFPGWLRDASGDSGLADHLGELLHHSTPCQEDEYWELVNPRRPLGRSLRAAIASTKLSVTGWHGRTGHLPTLLQHDEEVAAIEHFCGRDVRFEPFLRACWGGHLALLCGTVAILCERPSQILLDDQLRLHSEQEPALVYRSGETVWMEQGEIVPALSSE